MKKSSRKRHIAKAITWRLVGTIDTVVISWVITGNPLTGLKIGLAEVFSKLILYYLHERLWFAVAAGSKKGKQGSRQRHLFKTFTWRFVGTLDTIINSWIISGDPLTGLQIGSVELISKMLLYYLHERAWYKSDYGVEERRNHKKRKNYKSGKTQIW